LADYSITKAQAHRWKTMALVPKEELEQEFAIAYGSDDYELTSYAVYARGREIRRRKRPQPQAELPADAFNVILAAPDWTNENMSIDRLCQYFSRHDLPLADNAALFLWTLNPYLPAALTVLEAWGFTYRTNIARVFTGETKRDQEWYLCPRHNLLLVATRGAFDPPDPENARAVGTVINSRYDAYNLIEQLYPNCHYLELFTAHEHSDWSVYRDGDSRSDQS
jgi:N6-adenosine-specific RNA methylase IME4